MYDVVIIGARCAGSALALGRPYSGYYRPIAKKAAALVESMATNHGFVDGNKRTTLLLTITLLERSEYDLVSPEPNGDIDVELEELIVAVADGQLNVGQITEWFKARIRRMAQ
jgi:death on curing protein